MPMNGTTECRFDPILSHLPFPACRVDMDARLRYGNPAFSAEFGNAGADLLGRPLREVVATEIFDTLAPHLQHALLGESTRLQAAHHRGGFDRRRLEISALPCPAPSERIDGALLLIRDVTDDAQLAETQKQLTDHLAALDAHAIVAVTDATGAITAVNDKFCDISQYSREELYGHTHRMVKSGHHTREFYDQLWDTISSGRVWQGEICNRARDGSLYWVYSTIVPFIGADGLPFKYISIRADITQLKQVEQQAQRLALYDPLTQLPNRRLFLERLNQAMLASGRHGQHGALLSIDLDEFKRINDTHGHGQGDLLLRKAAQRLTRCVRESDTVARMGGDEFLILLQDLGAEPAEATLRAAQVGAKLKETLNQPYRLDRADDATTDEGVISTPSIGVVLFQGQAVGAGELLQRVDIAMYRAKANGRNQFVFFDMSQQEEAGKRYRIETDLRGAVAQQELRLYYQPTVDASRRVTGMEALVRWAHPTRGLVPPNDFIPIAEQSGLIVPIGHWVLETACAQLARWRADPHTAHWTLSVNVSARQFHDPQFVARTAALLASAGADPTRLYIELTETVLLDSLDQALQGRIRALRALCIKLALDDFGTGYSPLTYLRDLPLDRLKIDRSFVHALMDNPRNQIITRAITSMAGAMQLEVVAEGIETQAQFDHLLGIGCTAFQGYLFGRPEPLDTRPH